MLGAIRLRSSSWNQPYLASRIVLPITFRRHYTGNSNFFTTKSSKAGPRSYDTKSTFSANRFFHPTRPRFADLNKVVSSTLRKSSKITVDQFEPTERAAKAATIDLSAKLGKHVDGAADTASVVRLLKLAKPEARDLSIAFILLCLSSGIQMTIPASIGKIIDFATSNDSTIMGFSTYQFYFGLAGLFTLSALSNFVRVVLLRTTGERIVAKLRSKLYRNTMVQDAEFFDANRHGDLISRLSSDTTIVGKSLTQGVADGLRALVSASAGIAMMAWVSVKLTGIMMCIVPPIAIGAIFYGRYVKKLSKRTQQGLGDLTKLSEEKLGNVKTLQSYSGEIQEVKRYNDRIRNLFNLAKKEAFASGAFFSTTGLAGNATILTILAVGGAMVSGGSITIGELSSFLLYTAYAGSSMIGLSSFYTDIMKATGASSRLFELQDRRPSIIPTVLFQVREGHFLSRMASWFALKSSDCLVSFAYPTRPAVKIFDGLSFSINPGSNVAVVGPSGGGKSTITALLLRFYVPASGKITLNKKDIAELNLKQFRRRIGVVAQEPVLFHGTIAENISYGSLLASRAEILQAARRANCGFIADFPDGLETRVGSRGTQLSGGQKQRIAIARALIRNPDILILDEATSALDATSENLVNETLQMLMKDEKMTTISIAHRLATIRRADRIVVLGSNGCVEEEGTYSQLMISKGAFVRLMEWQLHGFDLDTIKRAPKKHLEEEEDEEEHRSRTEEEDFVTKVPL
ncbi:ATP-dependent permease MDL1, mitochondrial [Neolecta irregularis DAH-3]|uniref:ATP-dependent permease MDL1, mitochondrial n=1 Tax=Neolecta irregularis (strain DAH-3) TaxID=1198029 RepID=A0A1U7LRY1_NEOID|nr:ATP-dependent permease MDL1, mitochondrial [Neolecta irregularis DAH-3]|eukprot:OLL25417.1 ATP-dependent permease MDL1, mitochondrial [Neolecta irregularis DAH-3]